MNSICIYLHEIENYIIPNVQHFQWSMQQKMFAPKNIFKCSFRVLRKYIQMHTTELKDTADRLDRDVCMIFPDGVAYKYIYIIDLCHFDCELKKICKKKHLLAFDNNTNLYNHRKYIEKYNNNSKG